MISTTLPPPQFDPPTINRSPETDIKTGPRIGNVEVLVVPPGNLLKPSGLGLGIQLPFFIW